MYELFERRKTPVVQCGDRYAIALHYISGVI